MCLKVQYVKRSRKIRYKNHCETYGYDTTVSDAIYLRDIEESINNTNGLRLLTRVLDISEM